MKNVNNLQEMREKIKEREYYADEMSISIMERSIKRKTYYFVW